MVEDNCPLCQARSWEKDLDKQAIENLERLEVHLIMVKKEMNKRLSGIKKYKRRRKWRLLQAQRHDEALWGMRTFFDR